MVDEGAGGLSVAAIERCIDNWETETQDGDEIPAARAELAALQAAATETSALRAALAGLLGGINVYDRPDPNQSMCRGLHTLRMVDEAIALIARENPHRDKENAV
jgi:hypothetical protein